MGTMTGAKAARDIALAKSSADANNWLSCMQIMADNAATYLLSVAYVQTLGLRVKVNGARVRPSFEVRNVLPGVAELIRKKIANQICQWEVSYDLGITWIALLPTKQSTTSLDGLVVGSNSFFRSCAVVNSTASVWIVEHI